MTDLKNKIYLEAILLAAGSGERFKKSLNRFKLSEKKLKNLNKPKAFIKLGLKPIYAYSLETISQFTEQNILVIPKQYNKEKFEYSNMISVIGGKSRFDSVFNALQFLAKQNNPKREKFKPNQRIVLVHDCARVLLDTRDLKALIDFFIHTNKDTAYCSGVILANQLSDSIKQLNNNQVNQTNQTNQPNKPKQYKNINRAALIAAQTPQLFYFADLYKAYQLKQKDKSKITDEASAIEKIGLNYQTYLANFENFKITAYSDYLLAKIILKNRQIKL